MLLPVSMTAGLRPHPSNWTKEPEKVQTHCLYCKQAVPNHLPDCVVPRRTVVVEFTTKMVIEMPAYFSPEQIHFAMNESSACMSRYVDQLHEETNREPDLCNICSRSEMKYLGEATEEDHERLAFVPRNED